MQRRTAKGRLIVLYCRQRPQESADLQIARHYPQSKSYRGAQVLGSGVITYNLEGRQWYHFVGQ